MSEPPIGIWEVFRFLSCPLPAGHRGAQEAGALRCLPYFLCLAAESGLLAHPTSPAPCSCPAQSQKPHLVRVKWGLGRENAAKCIWRDAGTKITSSVSKPSGKVNFPGGSDCKDSARNAGDPGSIPGSGRSPGRGHDNPLRYPCLENPMERGVWL